MVAAKKVGLWSAATLAAAAFVEWFRHYRHRPMREGLDLPHFFLCETERGWPCVKGHPCRWMEDFHEPLAARACALLDAGRTPTVVHVGASSFQDDVAEYLPLLQSLRAHGRVRLVLVEPELEHRESLLRVHISLGLKAEDVTVVSTAMNRECNGTVVQYIFGDKLFDDFVPRNDPGLQRSLRSSLRSWRSLSRDNLLMSLAAVGTMDHYTSGEGSSQTYDWFHTRIVPIIRDIFQAGNASDYIEEVSIDCMSASKLMTVAELTPSDIAMLTVDAEGFDIPIMEGFVELPGFRPTLQRWEGALDDPNQHSIAGWFLSNGYRVGMNGYAHSFDIFAYLGRPI